MHLAMELGIADFANQGNIYKWKMAHLINVEFTLNKRPKKAEDIYYLPILCNKLTIYVS